MIILLTGTPGTGKTTVSPLLAEELNCTLTDINQLVAEKQLYTGLDAQKGYKIVDIAALEEELQNIIDKKEDDQFVIIEGHLSYYFPLADFVIVLRTEPSVLEDRLTKRDWKASKIHENLEAEALDICTWEAYQTHGSKVHEVDTTNITPEEAVNTILKIIKGEKSHPPGDVDFSGFLTG